MCGLDSAARYPLLLEAAHRVRWDLERPNMRRVVAVLHELELESWVLCDAKAENGGAIERQVGLEQKVGSCLNKGGVGVERVALVNGPVAEALSGLTKLRERH